MQAHEYVQIPRPMKYQPEIDARQEGIDGVFFRNGMRQPEEQAREGDARQQAKFANQNGLHPAPEEEFLGYASEEGDDEQVDGLTVRKDRPYCLIHFLSQPGKRRPVRVDGKVEGSKHGEREKERQEGGPYGRSESGAHIDPGQVEQEKGEQEESAFDDDGDGQ